MILLGSLAGIEIRVHYWTLIVFGALTGILAYGYLPNVTPAAGSLERLAVGIIVAALLAGSVLAHELGHALVARRRGFTVTGITLYLFGGFTNLAGVKTTPLDDIAIGLAGPTASAALAAIFLGASAATLHANEQAALLLAGVGIINAVLFVANILPGYPMDGGMVLRGILWQLSGNVVAATRRAATTGKIAAYLLAGCGVLLLMRGDVIDGMWIVLIGWMLAGLAENAYRSIIVRTALEGLHVKDLCARDLPVLQTSESVAAASAMFGGGAPSRVLAVMFGERLAGLATDVDVARVSSDQAGSMPISSVMLRSAGQPALDAESEALALLSALGLSPIRCVIAVDERGDYLGLVRQEDVTRYVDMIEALGNSSAISSRRLKRLQPRVDAEPKPNPADKPL
jgi:Zn-dependent protease